MTLTLIFVMIKLMVASSVTVSWWWIILAILVDIFWTGSKGG